MRKEIKIIAREKHSEHFINISPASDFIPEWYRKSESNMRGTNSELNISDPRVTNSTYKKCSPFYDALSSGYMVHLSADIEVVRKENNMPFIMWRTARQIITEHSNNQWDGMPVPHGYSPFVYKWHNQFGLQTPSGYSLLFTSPINRFDLPFHTITGIVDTDDYNFQVHFPFFIRNDFSGIVQSGTPIAHIIPIKRDNWKRSVFDYDQNETEILLDKFTSRIKRSYKNNFWKRKEYK